MIIFIQVAYITTKCLLEGSCETILQPPATSRLLCTILMQISTSHQNAVLLVNLKVQSYSYSRASDLNWREELLRKKEKALQEKEKDLESKHVM